jgi:hypothetical protein
LESRFNLLIGYQIKSLYADLTHRRRTFRGRNPHLYCQGNGVDMMDESELQELIRKGETQTLEFKKSLSLLSKGLESLCAMANSDMGKGTVLFGVTTEGAICGVEPGNLDTAQRTITQNIRQKIEPQLIANIEIVECSEGAVIVLSAVRDRTIPYHEYDGRAWIRQGTQNSILSMAEKQNLTSKRDRDSYQGPWRCDRCGSIVGQLFSYEVTPQGMKKTYKCHCGGEFWPIT